MAPAVALRDEQESDETFVAALYAGSPAGEMALVPWPEAQKAAFLRMQFALQRTHYRTHYADAAFSIVLVGDTPIGRLYVQRGPDDPVDRDHACTGLARARRWGRPGAGPAGRGGDPRQARLCFMSSAKTPPGAYTSDWDSPVADVGIYDRLEWSADVAPAENTDQQAG